MEAVARHIAKERSALISAVEFAGGCAIFRALPIGGRPTDYRGVAIAVPMHGRDRQQFREEVAAYFDEYIQRQLGPDIDVLYANLCTEEAAEQAAKDVQETVTSTT